MCFYTYIDRHGRQASRDDAKNSPLHQEGQCASTKERAAILIRAEHRLKWRLMLLPASYLAFGAGVKSVVDQDSAKELADTLQSNCCTSAPVRSIVLPVATPIL